MALSLEATIALAALERAHGNVERLSERAYVVAAVLEKCAENTRVYRCRNCACLFSIEPDGEVCHWLLRYRRG